MSNRELSAGQNGALTTAADGQFPVEHLVQKLLFRVEGRDFFLDVVILKRARSEVTFSWLYVHGLGGAFRAADGVRESSAIAAVAAAEKARKKVAGKDDLMAICPKMAAVIVCRWNGK